MVLKMTSLWMFLYALLMPGIAPAQTHQVASTPLTAAQAASTYARIANPAFTGTSNLPNGWGLGTVASGDLSNANVTATNGTLLRTLGAHFSDVIYARDRGVKCDGSTDDTTAINYMLQTLPQTATSSSAVIFPAGTCIFSGPITSGAKLYQVAFIGQGQGATKFIYDGSATTGDLFFFQHVTLSKFEGFAIQSTTAMTSGCALHVDLPNRVVFNDILIGATSGSNIGTYNDLCISNPEITMETNLNLTALNDAIQTWGGGIGSGVAFGIWAQNMRIAAVNAGIHVGGGMDAIFVDNTIITESGYGIIDDETLQSGDTFPENLRLYFGPNVSIDFPANDGILINNPGIDTASHCPNANPNAYYCGSSFNYEGQIQDSPNLQANTGVLVQSFPQSSLHLGGRIFGLNGNGVTISDASARVFLDGSFEADGNLGYGVASTVTNPLLSVANQGALHDNVLGSFDANSTAAINAPGSFTTLNASGNDAINANSNTSGESIPNNALTLVGGWTTQMDRVGTNWTGSAGAFVAPATAPYHIDVQLVFNATGLTIPSGTTFKVEVVGQGIIPCIGLPATWPTAAAATGGYYTVQASCNIQGTAGQGIGVEAFQNSGQAVPLLNAASTSYLSISRIP